MTSFNRLGFAEFVFPNRSGRSRSPVPRAVDLVNPAIVGFSEDEFSLVMVDTSGEVPTYVGITHTGGYVTLSTVTGERQLLQRADIEAITDEVSGRYSSAINKLYAEKYRQTRLLSAIFFLALVATIAGSYIIWPVVKLLLTLSVPSLAAIMAAVVCSLLIFFAVKTLHDVIKAVVFGGSSIAMEKHV